MSVVRITQNTNWTELKSETFHSNFTASMRGQRDALFNMINDNIDAGVTAIVNIYQSADECMRSRSTLKTRNVNATQNAVWWDAECDSKKAQKYSLLRKFRNSNVSTDLTALHYLPKYV